MTTDSAKDSRTMDFLLVTGLSGAGLSTAAKVLEDLGWYVADNLPPELISRMVGLSLTSDRSVEAGGAVGAAYFHLLLECSCSQSEAAGASPSEVALEFRRDGVAVDRSAWCPTGFPELLRHAERYAREAS